MRLEVGMVDEGFRYQRHWGVKVLCLCVLKYLCKKIFSSGEKENCMVGMSIRAKHF